jgi:hypothetical protein
MNKNLQELKTWFISEFPEQKDAVGNAPDKLVFQTPPTYPSNLVVMFDEGEFWLNHRLKFTPDQLKSQIRKIFAPHEAPQKRQNAAIQNARIFAAALVFLLFSFATVAQTAIYAPGMTFDTVTVAVTVGTSQTFAACSPCAHITPANAATEMEFIWNDTEKAVYVRFKKPFAAITVFQCVNTVLGKKLDIGKVRWYKNAVDTFQQCVFLIGDDSKPDANPGEVAITFTALFERK